MIDRRCPVEGVSNREISANRKVMAGDAEHHRRSAKDRRP
jgi:hypothetical protein